MNNQTFTDTVRTSGIPLSVKYQGRTVICLAIIAGFTDAYGFLNFKTYLSFMSGNTTQIGFSIGQENYHAVVLGLLAIFSFVTGVFTGTLFSDVRRFKKIWMPYTIVSMLLLLYMFTTLFFRNTYYSIIQLGLSMGYMNTAISYVGKQPVNPDFVTGTLNNMARHIAFWINKVALPDSQGAWDTHKSRALKLIIIWISFLIGAFISVVIKSMLGIYALLFPALGLLAIAYAYTFVRHDTV